MKFATFVNPSEWDSCCKTKTYDISINQSILLKKMISMHLYKAHYFGKPPFLSVNKSHPNTHRNVSNYDTICFIFDFFSWRTYWQALLTFVMISSFSPLSVSFWPPAHGFFSTLFVLFCCYYPSTLYSINA